MASMVINKIAKLLAAYRNLKDNGNSSLAEEHKDALESLVKKYLPSGSGINSGVELDWTSTPDKIIFKFSYEHIKNDMYDHATDHTCVVTPSLVNNFDMEFTGKTYGIRDWLYAVFESGLSYDLERGE